MSIQLSEASVHIYLRYKRINWVSRDYIKKELGADNIIEVKEEELFVRLDGDVQKLHIDNEDVMIYCEDLADFEEIASIASQIYKKAITDSDFKSWEISFSVSTDTALRTLKNIFQGSVTELGEIFDTKIKSIAPRFEFKDDRLADYNRIAMQIKEKNMIDIFYAAIFESNFPDDSSEIVGILEDEFEYLSNTSGIILKEER